MNLEQLFETCSFGEFTENTISTSIPFSCGNTDLDEFFSCDSILYRKKLLGKTYAFYLRSNPNVVVGAFTLSNDSIRIDDLPNARKQKMKHIIEHKPLRRYPAVLIGRLGINVTYACQGFGSAIMDVIKSWFIKNNKTGCRFIIVEAYNTQPTLKYYEKNGFKYLFSTEKQESLYSYQDANMKMRTRMKFFDLIDICD